ncbi:MAG: acyl-CoA dehydratase activase-related protein [Nanoarchaeota archaeon]
MKEENMGFIGFNQLKSLEDYQQQNFTCHECDNNCEVSMIQIDNEKLYFGDICERYSGKAKVKCKNPFEDLFEKREKLLESYLIQKNGETIGIPRIGMFNDLFPLWASFFSELGLNVKPSDKTNKKIISKGLDLSNSEYCFPIKVAFGHYDNLNEKVDFIFSPEIYESYQSKFLDNGEIKNTAWEKSSICPFVQNFNSNVVPYSVNQTRLIQANLYFRQKKSVIKSLHHSLKNVGLKFKEKEIKVAFEYAENNYFDFKKNLRQMGNQTLQNLNKENSIVLVGRPYAVFDEAMNLRIASKIRNFGFCPIPIDMLPLPKEDLSMRMDNEFSIQGQLILNSANVIKQLDLNAIFWDFCNCGPNTFLLKFFEKEIGKNFCYLQIDENAKDAGLETRLEAYLNNCLK